MPTRLNRQEGKAIEGPNLRGALGPNDYITQPAPVCQPLSLRASQNDLTLTASPAGHRNKRSIVAGASLDCQLNTEPSAARQSCQSRRLCGPANALILKLVWNGVVHGVCPAGPCAPLGGRPPSQVLGRPSPEVGIMRLVRSAGRVRRMPRIRRRAPGRPGAPPHSRVPRRSSPCQRLRPMRVRSPSTATRAARAPCRRAFGTRRRSGAGSSGRS